jgi:excisionase family DNA binding protein
VDFGEVLTPREASELLVISPSSVYSLMRSGELPFFRIGSHFKIPKRQLAIIFGLMPEDK